RLVPRVDGHRASGDERVIPHVVVSRVPERPWPIGGADNAAPAGTQEPGYVSEGHGWAYRVSPQRVCSHRGTSFPDSSFRKDCTLKCMHYCADRFCPY